MTIYAECRPTHGPCRLISVYTVEGEPGCRVRERREGRRSVYYRSTATPIEFIAQHKHLGPWEITGRNTGECNGNHIQEGGAGEKVGAIEQAYRHTVYGQDILSGRGPYTNRLGAR